jgi:hypothetical protein
MHTVTLLSHACVMHTYMAHFVRYAIARIGNFTHEKNSVFDEISGMIILVPTVSNDNAYIHSHFGASGIREDNQ